MIIVVTGTPGTGKTTLAKALAKKLGVKYLDVTELIEEKSLFEHLDVKRDCMVVDTDQLNAVIVKIIEKNAAGIVIDSHLSHHLPPDKVDICIVCKCDLKILEKRLTERSYSKEKVRENLDSEIFEVCLNEAKELGHNVFEVDCTAKVDLKKIIAFLEENI